MCTTMQKITSFHQFILEIQSILESCNQTGHTHFWPCPSKNFLINFYLCKFVPICKKSGHFIDSLWRYGWLKNLAICWLITFWLISQEHQFSQIWDLCRNTANNLNFHYRSNPINWENDPFWALFPNIGEKKIFPENLALSPKFHMSF